MWHYIGTGTVLNDAWYRDLSNPDDTSTNNISEYINNHREQVSTEYIPDEIQADDYEVEDDHDDVDMNSESEDLDEETRQQAISAYEEEHRKYSAFMFENLHDKGMLKALQKVTQFMQKQRKKKNIQTLKRKLFDLCHESKKKIGNHIPVGVHSNSRRKYKSRGRVVSGYGRRVRDTALRLQMNVTESAEVVYPALNNQKKRTNRMVHDLSSAVAKNINNAKKH